MLRIFAERLPEEVLVAKVETVIPTPGVLPLKVLVESSVATSASAVLPIRTPSLLFENVLVCPPAPMALTVRFELGTR